ncbi:unnamed protein product [Orchesella dallaii]|uniref:Uncharacterized protein n=1 Tax=Orchesella dallaii TaxID=48710 RepID=A0ABP1QW45_9HEXA
MGAMRYTPSVLLLWMTLQCIVNSQVPSVNEPFPGDHGPEPTPAPPGLYSGCPEVCVQKLESAMILIRDLQTKVQALNITVSTRINELGGEAGPTITGDLPTRVTNLETHLYGNVTAVTNKLSSDLAATSTSLQQEMNGVRIYVDDRLAKLPAGGTGGEESAALDVYRNLTGRLDVLENFKVQTLIDENNVWRKNFEVVNRTFTKLRKSRYSNDVIVVG